MTNTLPNRLPDDTDYTRMKSNVLTVIAGTERRRTVRHRITAAGLAGTLAIATSAAAIAVASAPQAQVNYTADCYAAASLTSQHGTSLYLPGATAPDEPLPVAQRVELATEMCSLTWSIGTFETDPTAVPSGGEFPVPVLVACQLPDNRLGIFPSIQTPEQLCNTLGLPTPHD